MGHFGAAQRFVGLVNWFNALSDRRICLLKALVFAACVIAFVWPSFDHALQTAERYRGMQSQEEWDATTTWLNVAKCSRATGSWLMLCERPGELTPMSADDTGHAFLLGLWSRLADRDATLLDVARLNLGINLISLIVLAATLAVYGAFLASTVVLIFGPTVYFSWFGVSPHWAVIGVASLQVVLPLAIIARYRRWLPPAVSGTMIVVGLLSLGLASLIREVAGSMGLLMTFLAIGWLLIGQYRTRRPLVGLLALAVATMLASQTARVVVSARDVAYSVDTTQLVATHGMSHTLFVGLGSVENKFGLVYSDDVGWKAAADVKPGIEYFSREYYLLLRQLYLQKWAEDPQEVIRIYLVKLKLALVDTVLHETPPLWIFLSVCLGIHWLANGRRLSCGSVHCDQLLVLNLVMTGFIGLFIGQAVLAHLSRLYAAPTGTFMIAMIGLAVENIAGWAWRRWQPARADKAGP